MGGGYRKVVVFIDVVFILGYYFNFIGGVVVGLFKKKCCFCEDL